MIAEIFNPEFLYSVFRMATPLLFAALGGLISERSGIINIALEGHMLLGAFVGASVALLSHSPWLPLCAGFAGFFLATLYALFVIDLKAEPVVAGTALNLLMIGSIPLLSKSLFDTTGSTPRLDLDSRFFYVSPSDRSGCCFGHSLLAVSNRFRSLGVLCRSKTRSSGSPRAQLEKGALAFSPGCGWFGGLGSSSLSLYLASSYSPLMSGGRGFMALAAMIFGRWQPLPTLGACLFFGLTEALQIRMQGISLGEFKIPVQLIQMIPYVVTLVVLTHPFRRRSL